MSKGALTITIDDKKVRKMMTLAPVEMKKALRKSLTQGILKIQNDAKKLAPYDTGQLRRSITHEVHEHKWAKTGTNLVYAPIQEFGGTIRAKSNKYLKFKIKGKWVMVKKVTIKGKHYFKKAYEKNINKILDIFERNINKIFD